MINPFWKNYIPESKTKILIDVFLFNFVSKIAINSAKEENSCTLLFQDFHS